MLILILFLFFLSELIGQELHLPKLKVSPVIKGKNSNIELFNLPTGFPLNRGLYDANFRIYDDGGVLVRFHIAISDNLMIGVPLSFDNLIGKGTIKTNFPPAVAAKIKLFNKTNNALSIGYYDPYGYGKKPDENNTKGQKGLFISFSQLFWPKKFSPHLHVSSYVNVEEFKSIKDIILCSGFDTKIKNLLLFLEIEKIFLNPIYSYGIKIKLADKLGAEVVFRHTKNSSLPARVVRIAYLDRLFF